MGRGDRTITNPTIKGTSKGQGRNHYLRIYLSHLRMNTCSTKGRSQGPAWLGSAGPVAFAKPGCLVGPRTFEKMKQYIWVPLRAASFNGHKSLELGDPIRPSWGMKACPAWGKAWVGMEILLKNCQQAYPNLPVSEIAQNQKLIAGLERSRPGDAQNVNMVQSYTRPVYVALVKPLRFFRICPRMCIVLAYLAV